MGIKARPSDANPGSPVLSTPSEQSETLELGVEDELVMVLFPKFTWEAVVQLSQELNVSPAEALGAAIKLLRARVDEEKAHV